MTTHDHVVSRGPTVFAVTTVTIALASVFVIARLISRLLIVKRRAWDDYWMVVAWVRKRKEPFGFDKNSGKGQT